MAKVVDVAWKFGVKACSSEDDALGQSCLQLQLSVASPRGGVDNVHVEMTLRQFYKFLEELERCRDGMSVVG